MPTLTPTDADPFALTLTPIEHNPYDPLAASAGVAPAGTRTLLDLGAALGQHGGYASMPRSTNIEDRRGGAYRDWYLENERQTRLAEILRAQEQIKRSEDILNRTGFAPPPSFAEGGRPLVGVPSVVGEQGPETFIPDPYDPLAASAGVAPAGAPRVDQINWGQPSWTQQALEQSQRDREAYARGGVPAMMKDTETTQDLASGFGGGAGIAGTTKAVGTDLARMVTAPPFYSAVENTVASVKSPQAPASQWWGLLKNAPGVKPDELEHLGVEDFLKGQQGPVTKQALQEHIAGNKVELQEVMKGAPDKQEITNIDRQIRELSHWPENPGLARNPENQATLDNLNRRWEAASTGYGQDTKFGTGQSAPLPGGENYRELLLTLPDKRDHLREFISNYPVIMRNMATEQDVQNARRFNSNFRETAKDYSDADVLAAANDVKNGRYRNTEQQFRGSHWDEPNVLAHIRFDDRNIGGDKTLHLAEIQSDWHQKGRREGYNEGNKEQAYNTYVEDLRGRLRSELYKGGLEQGWDHERASDFADRFANSKNPMQLAKAMNEEGRLDEFHRARIEERNAVPNAPFKTTWPELALKRMIRYAAENGYDRISWDTGLTNAERYDLSKQVHAVHWYPSDGRLAVIQKGNSLPTDLASGVQPEKLADYIGKEAAEKITKAPVMGGAHVLTGLDLKVGGEGMKGFYDRMLPNIANKLGKKYGARVEEGRLQEKDPSVQNNSPAHATALGINPVHSLKITPELRDQAMQRGFPMFSADIPHIGQQSDEPQPTGQPPQPTVTLTPVDHNPYDPLAASAGVAPTGTRTLPDLGAALGQPSWTEQAIAQSQRDREAYARGGAREMLKNTEGTQDLAGGFGDAGLPGGIGVAGTFGGRMAATANKAMLAKAEEMAAAGAPRESIWNQTGWFQGADKKWRFEIPDQSSRIGEAATDELLGSEGKTSGKAAGVVWHQPLYEAYPQLRNLDVDASISMPWEHSSRPSGSFGGDYYSASGHNLESIRGTALHELQHGVQAQEGFATGSNKFGLRPNTPAWDIYRERLQAIRDSGKVSHEQFSKMAGYEGLAPKKDYRDFVKMTRRISPEIDRAAQEYAAQEAYRRHAGEVEARNVKARMNMTLDERRAAPPWTTEDVPAEQQIVRFPPGPPTGP